MKESILVRLPDLRQVINNHWKDKEQGLATQVTTDLP
jgi:hypothetical protein